MAGAGQLRSLGPVAARRANPPPQTRPGLGRGVAKRAWLASVLPQRDVLVIYLMLAALLGGTFLLGLKGVGLARPLFIAGCLAVAWRAWRRSPGLHVEVVIALFAFAPFLRRVVDSHTGYNASGIMLIGPLIALSVALVGLRTLLHRRRGLSVYLPYGIMTACLIYGWAISAFQANLLDATVDSVKCLVPMLYAMYLIQRGDDCEEIIQGAARAFLVVSPIIGIYGVIQYLSPPEWDRYWMIYSQMKSIGLPEARQIRVFSTMNSPASFAMFAACGLLLFGFCRRGFLPILLVVPICIALLLTSVRTAWITCAIGMFYCFFFNATRSRATLLALCMAGAGATVVLLTPFGDTIGERLSTLGGDPAQDGSGHARIQEYAYVYSSLDHYLFGNGLGSKVRDLKLKNIDGQFIASAVAMGIFIGNIHVIAVVWAAVQGLMKVKQGEQPLRLVAAAVVVSYLLVLPLLVVTTGEVSFLFWLFVGVLPAAQARTLPPRLVPIPDGMVPGVARQRRHPAAVLQRGDADIVGAGGSGVVSEA